MVDKDFYNALTSAIEYNKELNKLGGTVRKKDVLALDKTSKYKRVKQSSTTLLNLGIVKSWLGSNANLAFGYAEFDKCNVWSDVPFDLNGVTFTDCVFRGVNFEGINITNCTFKNCQFIGGSYFGDVNLTSTKFIGCTLGKDRFEDIVFSNCTLNKVTFEGCTLCRVTEKSCKNYKVKYKNCVVMGILLANTYNNCSYYGVGFSVDGRNIAFKSCTFENCNCKSGAKVVGLTHKRSKIYFSDMGNLLGVSGLDNNKVLNEVITLENGKVTWGGCWI